MSDDLPDKDPFADEEVVAEENLISDAMVKKITYLIHKLAEQKGKEYWDIQKRCRSIFKYDNLAKVSKEQGHEIINKLLKITGGEEEKPQQGAKVTDDRTTSKKIEKPENEEKETVPDDDTVTRTMREAVRAAVNITLKEVVKKDVPVQGLGGFVLEIGKVIFEAKISKELSPGGI